MFPRNCAFPLHALLINTDRVLSHDKFFSALFDFNKSGWSLLFHCRGFPVGVTVKNLPGNAGDTGDAGSVPESGRSNGEADGNLLRYSSLGNPMDSGTGWAIVHGLAESDTTEHTHTDSTAFSVLNFTHDD